METGGFLIRELSIGDYDALVALWDESGLPYKPAGRDARGHIARELEGPSSIFLVAEVDGKLAGAVLGTHDGRKGWINRLSVAPKQRRKGIGRALVRAVEERLAGIGIEIVTCLVETWNETSLAFFEAIGYVRHDDIVYFSKRKGPDV
ncbi:GNAT family N-acetyltransferase [Candidatus Acetothermia bacterium]|nr:MAG: GNAT family N-acetyltransferase [Candidatus Acetothermia bacterium]